MRPVARGIAGGLLLSLVVVAGLTLLSGVGTFAGSPSSADKVYFGVSVTTTPAMSTTTTATVTIAGPAAASTTTTATVTIAGPAAASTTTTVTGTIAGPPAANAAQSAGTATISSVQTKSSYSVLLTFLPVAAALALGASVYLISRSRIEKEA